eukprot:7361801-Ditylum_brightwellii.AAC.1
MESSTSRSATHGKCVIVFGLLTWDSSIYFFAAAFKLILILSIDRQVMFGAKSSMAVVVSAVVEPSSLMFGSVSPGIGFGGATSLLMEEGVLMSG